MTAYGADILLVQDSISDVELFGYALEASGSTLTLQVARDGVEALAALLGEAADGAPADIVLPRLVVLDLNMPRLNGFEVLDRLRADPRTQALAVVVFSASDQEADRHEALRLGANDYLRKPAGFVELCTVVAGIEARWLAAT